MCSSYRSNQNPQTVKLSLGSSVGRNKQLPCQADMQPIKRRCVQTAHISLHTFNFQRAQTQNARHNPTSGASAVAYPVNPSTASAVSLHSVAASLRRLRFGEPLSRPHTQNPQEKKAGWLIFFSVSFFAHNILGLQVQRPLNLRRRGDGFAPAADATRESGDKFKPR